MIKIYAIIPAAGKGSRLKLPASLPKLLYPLRHASQTPWSLLRDKLCDLVNHIHLIVSPAGEAMIQTALQAELQQEKVSISLQPTPAGMGDALFCSAPFWQQADQLMVIWGDQIWLSRATVIQALAKQAGRDRTITLPLVLLAQPYVEYLFNQQGQLQAIHEAREGETCQPFGWGDVGIFVLSVRHLLTAWQAYQAVMKQGKVTKEINFLPFLLFLTQQGWSLQRVIVDNPLEARGLNTPDDLTFFLQQHTEP